MAVGAAIKLRPVINKPPLTDLFCDLKLPLCLLALRPLRCPLCDGETFQHQRDDDRNDRDNRHQLDDGKRAEFHV